MVTKPKQEGGSVLRLKIDCQRHFSFRSPGLKVTQVLYQKYEAISNLLDENPKILGRIHRDLTSGQSFAQSRGPKYLYSSDTILRCLLVMVLEGLSLRETVIRIDDSVFLREFVRIYDGRMLDYSTLDKAKNEIDPRTWDEANHLLARFSIDGELISGDRLRMDTTAIITDIHHPTDSALLWDCHRVLGRLIRHARYLDAAFVDNRRLHDRRAKRLQQKISRLVGKKSSHGKMKECYSKLIGMVEGVLEWSGCVERQLRKARMSKGASSTLLLLAKEIAHFRKLTRQVCDQAARRVLNGESVPNNEKIFSIFEEHTELLKRGKSWNSIEYGHMLQIEQVSEKFITHYEVFDVRPTDHSLLEPAVERHKHLFGSYPDEVAADKGYYEGAVIARVEEKVSLVSIGKKGRTRTPKEEMFEYSKSFKLAQSFRAGVEGTISFLKRSLGLSRCRAKGWDHYVATISMTILAHNLLKLAEI